MQTFLRWNGGKSDRLHIYRDLLTYFPIHDYVYAEPFLGGASLYFHLGHLFPTRLIGDIDPELVNLYRAVRDDYIALTMELLHQRYWYAGYDSASKQNFYRIRDEFQPSNNIERAARTFFLNRSCINGLMRQGPKGYNMAAGDVGPFTVPDLEPYAAASRERRFTATAPSISFKDFRRSSGHC